MRWSCSSHKRSPSGNDALRLQTTDLRTGYLGLWRSGPWLHSSPPAPKLCLTHNRIFRSPLRMHPGPWLHCFHRDLRHAAPWRSFLGPTCTRPLQRKRPKPVANRGLATLPLRQLHVRSTPRDLQLRVMDASWAMAAFLLLRSTSWCTLDLLPGGSHL